MINFRKIIFLLLILGLFTLLPGCHMSVVDKNDVERAEKSSQPIYKSLATENSHRLGKSTKKRSERLYYKVKCRILRYLIKLAVSESFALGILT